MDDLKSNKVKSLLLAGLLLVALLVGMVPPATGASYTKYATTSGTDGFGSPEKVQGAPDDLYADAPIDDQFYVWGGGYATETGTISTVVIKVRYQMSAAATNDTLTLKYSLDGGISFGATQYTWIPGDTTWTEKTLDVSADRTWSWTNISNLSVWIKCAKVAGPDGVDVRVDALYVTITTNEPPSVPTLSSPSNGSTTGDNTPTFQWQASTDPESDPITYDLQVDDDSGFSSPEIDETGLSGTSYTSTTELSDGTYYWYVRAVDNNNNQSNWASAWTVTVSTVVAFDFSISASPDTLSVQPGSDNTTTITVTLEEGSTQNVSLSGSWIGGTPTGVSTNFNPSSGNPTYSSTLTFTATASASEGNFTYRVSGTDGGVTRTTDITLVVGTPPFDFSVDASPASLTIWQGDTGTSTVTATLVSGSPETVSLSGSWVGTTPSGVNASFNPSSGSPTYDSVLTFTTTGNASTGTFTYRVTGQNGGLSRTKDITLTINEVTFSFSLSASPDSLTLVRSDSATSTISLAVVAGTVETVNLSGSWVDTEPTGVSAGFSPSSGTPQFSSTLTFTTTSGASAGTFTYRVSGTDGGMTRTDDITVIISTQLTLTLATDNNNYEKGQTIQISGTATDPKGNSVSSGTATVQYSYGDWSWENIVQISNGAYSDSFQISFGNPEGTWTIEISAGDSLGNSGSASTNIGVTTPAAYAYYTVQILSPVAGLSYSRGDDIDISVKVTESGANVENAEVSLTTPTGEEIALTETSPGTYTGRYSLEWNDPEETWSISVEVKKTVENTFKAGGGYINVEVEPATLQVTLLNPTKRKFEVGQSITVSAEVSYPDGTLVEDVVVGTTTPSGEDLTLAYESAGVYSTNYVVTEQDVGSWTLEVSVEDLYGNSGSKTSVISVVPMGTVGVLGKYWWAVLGSVVAIGVASAFATRKAKLAGRLKRITKERREIIKLMKEAETRYYKERSITRDTFDELIRGYEKRAAELEKEERVLKAKVKKVKGKGREKEEV